LIVEFHTIDTKKVKNVIEEYKLRYSILHFQVFFVDENNNAYPTDMQCHTEPMYEYEGKNFVFMNSKNIKFVFYLS
jgi:hypothetical protein